MNLKESKTFKKMCKFNFSYSRFVFMRWYKMNGENFHWDGKNLHTNIEHRTALI